MASKVIAPIQQLFGSSYSGYKLFTYLAGTSTKTTTYKNSTGSSSHSNPILLDAIGGALGETGIWIDPNKAYKFLLTTSTDTDPPGSSTFVYDNITVGLSYNSTSSVSTTYSHAVGDNKSLIKLDATSSAFTVTLLAAATAGAGFETTFKKVDSSSNAITLDGNSTETIDGISALALSKQNESVTLVSDGSNWQVKERIAIIRDANGNEVLIFGTTSNAVNEITVTNASTTNGPTIAATGDDTNIDITVKGKGTGKIKLGQATSTGIQLEADQPILDSSGNELIKFSKTASAVNEITAANSDTGNDPTLSATGGDTNIGISFQSKGSGTYKFKGTADSAAKLELYEDTDNGTNKVSINAPSSVTADRTFTIPDSDVPGHYVQSVSTQLGDVSTHTGQIPADNTTPQNTEGSEFLTLSITPKNSNNILVITGLVFGSVNAQDTFTVALFQDSTADALAVGFQHVTGANLGVAVPIYHRMTAGTTSATTFKIRTGPNGANTLTHNGTNGNALFTSKLASHLRITEYTA